MLNIYVFRDIIIYMCNIIFMDMMYCLFCVNEFWVGIFFRGGVVFICGGFGFIGMYRLVFIKDI